MSARVLRRIVPLESQVQNGVLELLRMMRHDVAWVYKVPVGQWVIVRPDIEGTVSVRKQLEAAANAGFIKQSQIGFILGAPEDTLDIAMQLVTGQHAELEVKQPGKRPTDGQFRRMALVRANGGFADWTDDIDDVTSFIKHWRQLGWRKQIGNA